jgi:mono/diheme cytochrome c family protein
LERGAGVFIRACSGCHGVDGRGGMAASGFTVPPRNFHDGAAMQAFSDDALRAVIRSGKGQMPAFGALLEEQEVTDVIAFVRSLSEPKP